MSIENGYSEKETSDSRSMNIDIESRATFSFDLLIKL